MEDDKAGVKKKSRASMLRDMESAPEATPDAPGTLGSRLEKLGKDLLTVGCGGHEVRVGRIWKLVDSAIRATPDAPQTLGSRLKKLGIEMLLVSCGRLES